MEVVFPVTGSAEQIDLVLLVFVHYCIKGRLPFYVARAAVLQVQLVIPRVRFRLTRTWSALKGWKKVRPGKPRTPLPEDLLPFLFLKALELSWRAESRAVGMEWLSFAVLFRLFFFSRFFGLGSP